MKVWRSLLKQCFFCALWVGLSAAGHAQTPDTGRVAGRVDTAAKVRQMETITIRAKVPLVTSKMDKLVYNAAGDLTSQGGVALDMLKKVPMVSVDIDGNVELQGNADVRFLINGKPSSIFGTNIVDVLQTLPASQIKSIEVITSPGAKYDAAGTGGIINIVLKDSRIQGINGSVDVSAGTRLESGAFHIDARKGSVGLNAFFSGTDHLASHALVSSSRQSFNTAKDTLTHFYQNGASPFVRRGYQSGLSLDWNLTPRAELTGTLGYDHAVDNGTGTTSQEQQTLVSSGDILSDVRSVRSDVNRFHESATNYSLAYKKTFKKKEEELDMLYTSSYGPSNTYSSQVSHPDGNYAPSGSQSNNPGKDHETDISVDYTEPVYKGFTIETGAKAVLENIHNSVTTDTLLYYGGSGGNGGSSGNGGNGDNAAYAPDLNQTYGFAFTRNIYAAYLSTSFSLFHAFLEGKAGMRYERTDTRSDFSKTAIPGYDLWAPSFLVEHKLGEKQSVKFAYTYRVERPDYDDLNPFVDISDPNNMVTGNPLLKTEIGHRFELGYNRSFAKEGSVYLGGYYNYNTNDIQTITTFYPVYTVDGVTYDNVSLSKGANIGSQTTFGAIVFGSVSVTDRLNLRSSMAFREQTNTMPGVASVSGFSYRINANVTYQFAGDVVGEAFGNYNSARTNFQSTRPAFLSYTLAARKPFGHNKASLGITATNAFTQYIHQRSTAYGDNFTQSTVRLVPLRSIGVTFSYKFGKLQVKKEDKEEDGQTAL